MQTPPFPSVASIEKIGIALVRRRLVGCSPEVLWAAILSLILAFGQMLPAAKLFDSPSNYLSLHTLLEFIAMAVSAMVFALAWNLRHLGVNSHRIILGAGFLVVAFIDFAHALSYVGMPALLTPSAPEKTISFWLAGRSVAAGALLPDGSFTQNSGHSFRELYEQFNVAGNEQRGPLPYSVPVQIASFVDSIKAFSTGTMLAPFEANTDIVIYPNSVRSFAIKF